MILCHICIRVSGGSCSPLIPSRVAYSRKFPLSSNTATYRLTVMVTLLLLSPHKSLTCSRKDINCAQSNSLTQMLSHTHCHTYTVSHTLSHTHSVSHTHTLCLTHTHTLSHTHIHTHTLSRTHKYIHASRVLSHQYILHPHLPTHSPTLRLHHIVLCPQRLYKLLGMGSQELPPLFLPPSLGHYFVNS